MGSYHFRNERKYKRRRALIAATTIVTVIAIVMAAYLLLNDNSTASAANSTAKPSTASASSSTKAAVTSTTAPALTTKPAADTAKATTKGVTTKDHGFLPNVASVEKSGKMDELKKLITDFTAKLPGKYGVTYIDLATGEMVNVKDQTEYIAASTSKLPINVMLFKDIEAGKVKLEDKLTYKKEDFEAGTGIIQATKYGTQYTVKDTSKYSIIKSDNCGVNMIIRQVGIQRVRDYMTGLGGKVYYGARHRSCPYDMALVAQDLYKLYLKNEKVYGELINNMENTDWHDRIDAKLPKSVKVAHKIGNQITTRNDVGIIFAKHPYILSIMTDKVNENSACTNIANLSKKIYDFEEAYAAKTPVQAK